MWKGLLADFDARIDGGLIGCRHQAAMLGGQDLLEILQTAGIHPLPGSGKSNIVSDNQVSETGNV